MIDFFILFLLNELTNYSSRNLTMFIMNLNCKLTKENNKEIITNY